MNALGIARVSSQEQAAEDRYSLANQRLKIRDYCRDRGWDLVDVFEYIHSGGSNQRELKAIMDRAIAEQVSCVVVFELDRLSRNLISTLLFIDDLRAHGIRFAAVANDIDLTTAEGELQLHLLSAFAQYFRAQLGRKVRGGQEMRVREGRIFGRVKFGYRMGGDGRLVPHEEEAKVVRMVYDWYLNESIGLREIAKRLNAMGVLTHEGKQWGVSSTRLLFTDPESYLGDVTYGKYARSTARDGSVTVRRRGEGFLRVKGAHPAILDADTVEAALRKRRLRSEMRGRAAGSPYLLSGLIRCGKCGGRMQVTYSGDAREKRRWAYYVCSAYVRSGTCQRNSIRKDLVEAAVVNDLQAIAGEADAGEIVREFVRADATAENARKAMHAVERQLAEIPEMIARGEDAMLRGIITPERFAELRGEKLAESDGLWADLEALKRQIAGSPNTDQLIASVKKAQKEFRLFPDDVGKGRAILQRFIEKVVVDGEAVAIHYRAE